MFTYHLHADVVMVLFGMLVCFLRCLELLETDIFFKLYLNCCLLLYIATKLLVVVSILIPDLLISSTAPRTYSIDLT